MSLASCQNRFHLLTCDSNVQLHNKVSLWQGCLASPPPVVLREDLSSTSSNWRIKILPCACSYTFFRRGTTYRVHWLPRVMRTLSPHAYTIIDTRMGKGRVTRKMKPYSKLVLPLVAFFVLDIEEFLWVLRPFLEIGFFQRNDFVNEKNDCIVDEGLGKC